MMLNIDSWNSKILNQFENYLYSIRNENKINWTKNTINTNMNVLAIKNPDLKKMAKEIFKGNYILFLDLMPHKYYEETIIDAYLIGFIKDFSIQKKYILELSKYIDNWATVDSIIYNIKNNEQEYFDFAKELLISKYPFQRRIGVRILFSYKTNLKYLDDVYKLLTILNKEEEYYVNMAAAWLLCELYIYNKDKTLEYIKNNRENKFIINKAISKCRDSFRVTKEEKDMLLNFKIK